MEILLFRILSLSYVAILNSNVEILLFRNAKVTM